MNIFKEKTKRIRLIILGLLIFGLLSINGHLTPSDSSPNNYLLLPLSDANGEMVSSLSIWNMENRIHAYFSGYPNIKILSKTVFKDIQEIEPSFFIPQENIAAHLRFLATQVNSGWIIFPSLLERDQHYFIRVLFFNASIGEFDFEKSFNLMALSRYIEEMEHQLVTALFQRLEVPGSATSYDLYSQALLAYQTFEEEGYREALSQIEAALDLDSENASIYGLSGVISARYSHSLKYMNNGRSEHFLTLSYSYGYRSCQMDRNNLYGRLALGLFYRERQLYEECRYQVENLLSSHPDHSESLCLAGDLHNYFFFKDNNDQTKALEYYELALQQSPDWIIPYMSKAYVLKSIGKFDESITVYSKALSMDPENLIALNNLGSLHFLLGRYCEALEYLQQAYNLQPDHPAILLNLAMALEANGNQEESLAVFHQLEGAALPYKYKEQVKRHIEIFSPADSP